jgi:tmRNA-binding protein
MFKRNKRIKVRLPMPKPSRAFKDKRKRAYKREIKKQLDDE